MPNDRDDRDYFMRRKSALEVERASFVPHYRELAEFIQPRRGRFLIDDVNKGNKRHQSIINPRASRAHKIARAGLFAGVMSPARPWFKLETFDNDLMRSKAVQQWLYEIELQLRSVFLESNLYNMAPVLLAELLLFGTAAMSQMDDPFTLARFYTYPAGSYLIAQDQRLKVDTFVREYKWTASNLVRMFGRENVSAAVRSAVDRTDDDSLFKVVHFVESNPDFREGALESQFLPIRSIHFEPEGPKDTVLRRSGFEEFPLYVPRWEVTGEDIYGTNCPAMEALGSIKQLQIQERRKGQAIDTMVRPPLGGPPSLRNVPVNNLPGGSTIYEADQSNRLQPLYQIDPRVGELRLDIQAVEQIVNEAFFVDMFMAISSMPGIQPKNQLELSQRNEERLLQLGPTLEQLHGEFLSPLIDRTFNQLVRIGAIPDPPLELEGQPLRVRFVSVLALAQRVVEVQSIERFSLFVDSVAQTDPRALDKRNTDDMIDQYAQLTGVIPSIVVDTQVADAVRQQRAVAAQEAALAEQAQQMAQAGQQTAGAVKQLTDAEAVAQETETNGPG